MAVTTAPLCVRRAAIASIAALVLVAGGCAPDPTRPDLVLVVIDTLRADHVGLYGSQRPTTPNLDALAAEGSWFQQAYAHSGWTLPSMASLLTGLLPHQHRAVRDPEQPRRFGRLAPETVTLAERLGEAGYACGAVVNNTYFAPIFGLDQGFGDGWNYRGASNAEHRSADATVAAALAWLAAQSPPVFLLVHFMEPHLLYDPAPAVRGTFTGHARPPVPVPWGTPASLAPLWRGEQPSPEQIEYIRQLYDEEVLAADRALGRLLEALRQRSRWPDTVVVVTADHGEEFFEHGGFEHGHTLYAELTRVPLVVAGPGLARGERSELVRHVDVAQGLLALAGASPDPAAPDLFSALRAGRRWQADGLLTENVLYGAQRVAYSQGPLRLHLQLGAGTGEVWRLDAQGVETARLEPPELRPAARRLTARLRAERGDLEPIAPPPGPALDDPEILRQLISLGYVEPAEAAPGVYSR